jgi:hypothetical protein
MRRFWVVLALGALTYEVDDGRIVTAVTFDTLFQRPLSFGCFRTSR